MSEPLAVYDFNTQLTKGEKAELELDAHFRNEFQVHRVSDEQQRNGLDRVFIQHVRGRKKAWLVEYKADWAASKTGNAFVETVSIDRDNKPGWAYTSMADYLMYYLPNDLLIYIFTLKKLRAKLAGWLKNYPTRKIPNQGYSTVGVLVPLYEFEQHANEVVSI